MVPPRFVVVRVMADLMPAAQSNNAEVSQHHHREHAHPTYKKMDLGHASPVETGWLEN